MTLKRFVAALFALALVSTLASAGDTYGKPLTGEAITPVSVLMDQPDAYVGKTVRVSGTITGVCEKRGCWMTLAWSEKFEDIKIKVEDDVIVFPIEAKGKSAIAEGTFTKIEMDLDQTIAYFRHLAEERDEEFDSASVTEPHTYFQIKATGAIIR